MERHISTHTHAAYSIWAGTLERTHKQQIGRRTAHINADTRSIHTYNIHTSTRMRGIESAHTHIHIQHTVSTHTVYTQRHIQHTREHTRAHTAYT